MRLLLPLWVVALTACPPPSEPDSGPGGGGGSTGGSTGGSSGGGSGGSTGGGSATTVSLADFCARQPAAACGLLERCGALRASERSTCEARFVEQCRNHLLAIDSGTRAYDTRAGAVCLDALATRPCSIVPGFNDFECGAFRYANYPTRCGPFDCDAGTYCDFNACPSRCRAWRAPGETCLDVADPDGRSAMCDFDRGYCPRGFSDGGLEDGGTRRCLPYVALGDECGFGDDRPCNPTTLFCDQVQQPARCVAKFDAGAPCTIYYQCPNEICNGSARCGFVPLNGACVNEVDCGLDQQGPFCSGWQPLADGGVSPGTCRTRIATGGVCTPGVTYDDGCAGAGATCLNGRCSSPALFSLDAGSDCDPYYKRGCVEPYFCLFTCRPELFCATVATSSKGVCVPRLPANAPCNVQDVGGCGDGLVCNDGRCRAFGGPGTSCMNPRVCFDQFNCVQVADGGSECTRWPDLGAACTDACLRGYCDTTVDGGTCVMKLQPGAPCSPYSASCELGRCDVVTSRCPTACFL